jgi:hypothetical protein
MSRGLAVSAIRSMRTIKGLTVDTETIIEYSFTLGFTLSIEVDDESEWTLPGLGE